MNNIAKIKKAQLYLLIPIVLCFIAMVVLGIVHEVDYYAIPIVLIIFLGVAEIVLAGVRESKRTNTNIKSNSSSYNGKTSSGHTGYTSSPIKRATSDDFIREIDNYVAKEFPDLPLDEAVIGLSFKTDCLTDIRKAAYEMQKHLGISAFIITISLRKLNEENATKREAGHFRRTGLMTADIEIDSDLSKEMALTCLAHEMSHAYQSFKGKQPYEAGSTKEEQFTDLLTYYLGFSKLIKNGYYGYNQKLGYVEAGDFNSVEMQYSSRTSAFGSYKKEKNNLKELICLYQTMVEQVLSLCEDLLKKYLPTDDKEYVKMIYGKYNSAEVKEYISRINNNVDRRAKLNINMDQIGVEIKIEELMNDNDKIQRIHNYVHGN